MKNSFLALLVAWQAIWRLSQTLPANFRGQLLVCKGSKNLDSRFGLDEPKPLFAILREQETKRPKRYNPAAMEDNKRTPIHQRYDKAYKKLLQNREAFCRFIRSLVNEELAQKVLPENIEMVDKSYTISLFGKNRT